MLKSTVAIANEVTSGSSIRDGAQAYSGLDQNTRNVAFVAANAGAQAMFEQIRELVENMVSTEGPGDDYSRGHKAAAKAILDNLVDSCPWMIVGRVRPSDPDSIVAYAHSEQAAEREADRLSVRNRAVTYTAYPTSPLPNEGVDLCFCGSKYWDGATCHSCGAKFKPEGSKR